MVHRHRGGVRMRAPRDRHRQGVRTVHLLCRQADFRARALVGSTLAQRDRLPDPAQAPVRRARDGDPPRAGVGVRRKPMNRFCLVLLLAAACSPSIPSTCATSDNPDVVDACGPVFDGSTGAKPGTPDAGDVPVGLVESDGGTVDRLWFATTGDTRPGDCDQTNDYPKAAIAQIAAAMKALKVQFTVDLGDHMYVCNGSDAEARQQMGFYMSAIAAGPATWWMTMGNHECGNNRFPYSCFAGGPHDANFSAFLSALKRPQPYYFTDVATSQGKA